MEKVLKIGKDEVLLNNNVAWTMEYRDQFGKDILPVILPMIASALEGTASIISNSNGEISLKDIAEAVEGRAIDILLPMFQMEFVDTIINITWAMAKAADETILPPKQWVRKFDTFPVDVIAPFIFDFALKGFISLKNQKRLKNIKIHLQPLNSMTSSSQDLKEDLQ